jgi:hypothetical protein
MIEQPNKAIDDRLPNAQFTPVSKIPCEEVLARYTTFTPLLALQLYAGSGQPSGVIRALPQNAAVLLCGTSRFARRMIEVSWQGKLYAVFELDFKACSVSEPNRSTTD